MTESIRDDGPALLDQIQADLQMDDGWIVRSDRALTWWGEPIPITYFVSDPLMIGRDPSVNVVAATTVLTDVTAPSDQVLALVALANQYASAASLIWLEDERRVASVMAWHSYADVAARTSFEIGRSIASYTEVNARLGAWQDAIGGELYTPAHPESGVRKERDDMMNLVEREIVPAGRGANRWADFDSESLARQLTDAGIGISTGGPSGLTVEFALARDADEERLRLATSAYGDPDHPRDEAFDERFWAPTAMAQLACVEHPFFGQGLAGRLRFPLEVDGPEAFELANSLNIEGSRVDVPVPGAWSVDPSSDDEVRGVAFNVFVPNWFYREDWAPNLAWQLASLSRWAYGLFAPETQGPA